MIIIEKAILHILDFQHPVNSVAHTFLPIKSLTWASILYDAGQRTAPVYEFVPDVLHRRVFVHVVTALDKKGRVLESVMHMTRIILFRARRVHRAHRPRCTQLAVSVFMREPANEHLTGRVDEQPSGTLVEHMLHCLDADPGIVRQLRHSLDTGIGKTLFGRDGLP